MSDGRPAGFDPTLDLWFERDVPVPLERVWRGWTEPEEIKKWFTPDPWKTIACELDLRPGGRFATTMESPEGEAFPNVGCYLEVVPQERLVWTNGLLPGFRPAPFGSPACPGPDGVFVFTATIALAPTAAGTRYSAWVQHADADGRERHAAMGFEEGWGSALDQLVALIQGRR